MKMMIVILFAVMSVAAGPATQPATQPASPFKSDTPDAVKKFLSGFLPSVSAPSDIDQQNQILDAMKNGTVDTHHPGIVSTGSVAGHNLAYTFGTALAKKKTIANQTDEVARLTTKANQKNSPSDLAISYPDLTDSNNLNQPNTKVVTGAIGNVLIWNIVEVIDDHSVVVHFGQIVHPELVDSGNIKTSAYDDGCDKMVIQMDTKGMTDGTQLDKKWPLYITGTARTGRHGTIVSAEVFDPKKYLAN